MMKMNRRRFAAGGLATLAFAGFAQRALAAGAQSYRSEVPGYGPLLSDPNRLFDLPAGFRYQIVAQAGEAMDDGFIVPDKFDGMGCFALDGGHVALVRNHELSPEDRALGPTGGLARLEQKLAREKVFGADGAGRPLPGGTTTTVYDLKRQRRENHYLSLTGTTVNCAGGATPWGSWLSCEESVLRPNEVDRDHGWIFEVPARHRGLVTPVPLTAMGRFRHEAAAVDPRTGIVYLTEDREDGLFYRFIPNKPGALAQGGRLQALGFRDAPKGSDSRNWNARSFAPGSRRDAVWIDLDEIDSPNDDLRARGHAAGATLFARGEGIHYGAGEFYFTCTSGGAGKYGQIMRYVPSPQEGTAEEAKAPGRLQLFVESVDPLVMDYADNVTVAPWGHLIVCEDRTDNRTNHLKGVTPAGKVYTLARLLADTELAGVCFSPDGATLFVNIYRPGKTLAITGPWSSLKAA